MRCLLRGLRELKLAVITVGMADTAAATAMGMPEDISLDTGRITGVATMGDMARAMVGDMVEGTAAITTGAMAITAQEASMVAGTWGTGIDLLQRSVA